MKLFSSGVFLCLCVNIALAADPWPQLKPASDSSPLPGTSQLRLEGDISLLLAEGCDRFLDRKIEAAAEKRGKPDRENLKRLLGFDRETRNVFSADPPKTAEFGRYFVQKCVTTADLTPSSGRC